MWKKCFKQKHYVKEPHALNQPMLYSIAMQALFKSKQLRQVINVVLEEPANQD